MTRETTAFVQVPVVSFTVSTSDSEVLRMKDKKFKSHIL